MRTIFRVAGAIVVTALAGGAAHAQDPRMSFFITSVGSGDGANLGGLDGADRHCQQLASAAGARDKTWRAYLSTTGEGGGEAVDARDRIGDGPWYNYNGVMVADSVADLHSDNNKLNKENSISEKGEVINGRTDSPNMHDILTGSAADGTADMTCRDWTSNASDGSANVGHHDRMGGGADPTSWNNAHASRGCGQQNLVSTGGNGLFYCFAVD